MGTHITGTAAETVTATTAAARSCEHTCARCGRAEALLAIGDPVRRVLCRRCYGDVYCHVCTCLLRSHRGGKCDCYIGRSCGQTAASIVEAHIERWTAERIAKVLAART